MSQEVSGTHAPSTSRGWIQRPRSRVRLPAHLRRSVYMHIDRIIIIIIIIVVVVVVVVVVVCVLKRCENMAQPRRELDEKLLTTWIRTFPLDVRGGVICGQTPPPDKCP